MPAVLTRSDPVLTAYESWVRAHLAEGNVSEAIRQFESYRRLLDAELAVSPGEQLQSMLRRALARRGAEAATASYPAVVTPRR